ncbi:MAG: ABC transporter transmembrane domain-containing protein [Lautropia sp.]
MSRYRTRAALALLFLLLAAATTLVVPYGLKLLIDGGLTAGDTGRLAVIRQQFLLLLALALMMAVFTSARYYMVSWLGERITTDLREAVYANVLRQRPEFFETLQTGEVLSRLTGDTILVQTVVGSSLSVGLRSMIMMTGGILILAFIRPILVLTVVAILLLFILPLMLIGRRVRKLSRASQDRLADSSALASEILNAIPVVQSFGQERRESLRFDQASELTFQTAIHRTRMRSLLTALAITAVFTANLYGLYVGVQAVMDGRLSAGTLGQIGMLIAIVASSAAVLAEVWGDLLRAAGATERLLELLHAPGEAPTPRDHAPPKAAETASAMPLRFEAVRFSYPSRPTPPAIDQLTFDVPAGSTVALVGSSGAGKTTLFQLLQRFYDLDGGRILIGGRSIQALPLAQLRAMIALVPQDPVIFSGSAADNIRYARPDAKDEAVEEAARLAFADDFIRALPDGYQTFLGERGVRLSGGQRQRLAIARAILSDRPILLLDEATSALDAQSERTVQKALDAARYNRTTLVIAHRLATVQSADLIMVMEAGRIVESGTHRQLLALNGIYAKLAAMQFFAQIKATS